MNVVETLVAGLFDYAGMYPPASLSLRSAANNYLDYARGGNAPALGRFIVNADRLTELRSIASESLDQFKLSVIVSDIAELEKIAGEVRNGMQVETLEIRPCDADAIRAMAFRIPPRLAVYVESPIVPRGVEALNAISNAGMRAKIRMGGIVATAIPSVADVVRILAAMAKLRVPFKATAGLHHPIRSSRPLTYELNSGEGILHGFLNLCCAAALLYFGGDESDAEEVLGEQDPASWQIGPDEIQWRHLRWSRSQISSLRRKFFLSIGSCSFEEPMQDLRSLGWL